MTVVVAIVGLLAAVGAYRAGLRRGRFDEQFKKQRADGLFNACDAELNATKVKLSQALMQLEDARR